MLFTSDSLAVESYPRISRAVEESSVHGNALPAPAAALKASSSLHTHLHVKGLGEAHTVSHLLDDIVPGLNGQKTSANYYGFVTGGILPIAEVADNVVTAFDQNVQVHLPDQSVSTVVEDRALSMLIELLELGDSWKGKTFTTGATGSNILGLACGREAVIDKRLNGATVAKLGILKASQRAGIEDFQVLGSMGHSSVYKAASIVGLGSENVHNVAYSDQPWALDLQKLEQALQKTNVASIVVISCGEVNTGRFATSGHEQMRKIRALCDQYGAWLHVDAGNSLLPFMTTSICISSADTS
jgi:glutamate/tyrosine decarboxylase-like PLP-dependent enzyme